MSFFFLLLAGGGLHWGGGASGPPVAKLQRWKTGRKQRLLSSGANKSTEEVKALGTYEDFLPTPITTDSHSAQAQGRSPN